MHRLDTFPTVGMIRQYRNVFSAKEGPAVLAHLLYELGLFEDMPGMSAEDGALRNYGARLLLILGGGEVRQEAVEALVKRLMAQPLPDDAADTVNGCPSP